MGMVAGLNEAAMLPFVPGAHSFQGRPLDGLIVPHQQSEFRSRLTHCDGPQDCSLRVVEEGRTDASHWIGQSVGIPRS